MAEYIDREAVLLEINRQIRRQFLCIANVETIIKGAPAVDVAPVVRCKDCKHGEGYERMDGRTGYYCGHPQSNFTYGEHWERIYKPAKEANDFCSYGERMDGDAE